MIRISSRPSILIVLASVLALTRLALGQAPLNDDCEHAIDLQPGPFRIVATHNATPDTGGCGASFPRPSIWFRYVATAPGPQLIATRGAQNTRISVYQLGACGMLAPPVACGSIYSAGDGLSFDAPSVGNTYLIELEGGWRSLAFRIGPLFYLYSDLALSPGLVSIDCQNSPSEFGVVTVTWVDSIAYDAIDVYLDDDLSLTLPGTAAATTLTINKPTRIWIAPRMSSGFVEPSFCDAVPNDYCETAQLLLNGVPTPFSLVGATPEPAGTPWAGHYDNTVWFRYVSACSGRIVFDSSIAVFPASSGCSTFGSSLLPYGHASLWPVQSGDPYLIAAIDCDFDCVLTVSCESALDLTGQDVIFALESPAQTNSVAALRSALEATGIDAVVVEDFGLVTGLPRRAWFCLGTYPSNYVLSQQEGEYLADLIAAGTHVYLESGDTWGFDAPTDFRYYDGVDDSLVLWQGETPDDLVGASYSLARFSGLSADYSPDQAGNDWNDRILATTTDLGGPNAGVVWFETGSTTGFGLGVYHDTDPGFGKVLVQSWEFGGFVGDQVELVGRYLAALGGTAGVLQLRRGDVNLDGSFDLADGLRIAAVVSGVSPVTFACDDAADINDDGSVSLLDAIAVLAHLFAGAAPPPAPFPACGVDPSMDGLACSAFPLCP